MRVKKVVEWKIVLWMLCSGLVGIHGSEFPERECCDGAISPDGPQPGRPDEATVNLVSIGNAAPDRQKPFPLDSNSFPEYYPEIIPVEREMPDLRPVDLDNAIEATTGFEVQPGKTILNCLLAHQLCTEEASCSSMLTVIRHLCGADTVACSTTTVTKCQAGLRTLQAFPYFRPTCLCREPHLDPECNTFRNFLFDHSCMVATQREKDKHPFDALPFCTHAMEVCQKDEECITVYNNFKDQCRVKEGRCRLENRDECYNAWRRLRTTPLFGCICPNNQSKKKCDRVYTSIYNNSCIGSFSESGEASPTLAQHATTKPSFYVTPSHRDSVDSYTRQADVVENPWSHRHPVNVDPGTVAAIVPPVSFEHPMPSRARVQRLQSSRTDRQRRFIAGRSNGDFGLSSAINVHNPMIDSLASQRDSLFQVRGISHVVYTPLGNDNTSWTSRSDPSNTMGALPEGNEAKTVMYESTCHRAQSQCQLDQSCRRHLEPVLRYCDSFSCNRDLCMQALQGFYKNAPSQLAQAIAFCVCKRTADRNDACLIAQEKLHPDCARRSDRLPSTMDIPNSNPPANYAGSCNQLVEDCKVHPDCRPKLEFYEQACAMDIATRGCAGPPFRCREAVLEILGTELRTSCNCRASDGHLGILSLYECLEWQKLLWLNPCVVEAQRVYHKDQGNIITVPLSTLSPTTTRQTTTLKRLPVHTERPGEDEPPPVVQVAHDRGSMNHSETSTAAAHLVTTTALPQVASRVCVLKRGKRHVSIPLGTGRRFYSDDDPDCSDVCRCLLNQNQENLTCTTYCAERRPCNTAAANYSHSGAAFQAYRGECICLSGSFVCARPDPDQYSLSLGVFLFLGYSQTDEKAMERWTNLSISKHVLDKLQQIIRQFNEQHECRLSVLYHIQGNLVLQVRLTELDVPRANNNSITLDMLLREKANCSATANRIRHMINARLPEVHEDELLSVIKVSDVSANLPEPRRSSGSPLPIPLLSVYTLCLLLSGLFTR